MPVWRLPGITSVRIEGHRPPRGYAPPTTRSRPPNSGADDRADGVDHRGDVRCLRVDDHDVGLLARRDRSSPIGDPGDLRLVEGRPAQYLARGDEIRGVVRIRGIRVPRRLVAAAALR